MRGTTGEKAALHVYAINGLLPCSQCRSSLSSFTLGPTHVANPEPMLSRARTCHIHRASSVPIDIAHTVMEGFVEDHDLAGTFDLPPQASVSPLLEISVIFGQK